MITGLSEADRSGEYRSASREGVSFVGCKHISGSFLQFILRLFNHTAGKVSTDCRYNLQHYYNCGKTKPGLHDQAGKRGKMHRESVQKPQRDYRVNCEMNFQAFSQL